MAKKHAPASDETAAQDNLTSPGRRDFLKRSAILGISLSPLGASLPAWGATGDKADNKNAILTAHMTEDIRSLDPAFLASSADYIVATNIYQNLVTYKPGTWELADQLAQSWSSSDDGLQWHFELKKGIQFHKGYGEVTAEDVKFSFERIAGLTKPKIDSTYKLDWATLKEVKVTGKYTGTIILRKAFAPLMNSTIPVTAGHIVSKKAVKELGDKFATNPVGTGPYEFTSWNRNENLKLTRFSKFSQATNPSKPPEWETVNFSIIPESNTAAIALQTGDIDFAYLAPSKFGMFKGNGKYSTLQKPTLNYYWIGMNVVHKHLKDKNVRLAVRYGIDVPSMIEAAYEGYWKQANSLIAPGMPIGYWKDAPFYKRDVDKARQYLKRAGAEGLELVMTASDADAGAKTVAEIVQQNLKDIGINVKVEMQDSGVFYQTSKQASAQRQLFYASFEANPDPSWVTEWFTCDQVNDWNFMSWCNKKFTELHNNAVRTLDKKERNDMYIEMQKLMDQDVVGVWVAWPTDLYAMNKGFHLATRPDGRYIAWDCRSA